jgi:predicted transposase/invertase (TIGR01784 family)
LELRVQVRNINKGHSAEIVKQSPLLLDYVAFVEEVREANKEEGISPELAMEKAIENCIKKGILTIFLTHHKEEVIKMLVAEWDYDLDREVAKDEGIQIGLSQGLSQGLSKGRDEERRKIIKDLYRLGIGIDTIAKAVDLSERQVKDILGL